MFDNSHSTEIPCNQFIPCSTSEAVGIACRAAWLVHVAGSLMLCLVGALLLGSEFWTKNGVALTLFILMVQFALFGVVMIPAAYMSAFFARAWFHESRFITIERAIWILILTVEANLIGWIVIPWFCLTL